MRGIRCLGFAVTLVWAGCSDDEDVDIDATGGVPGAGGIADYTGGNPTTGGRPNERGGSAGAGTAGELPGGGIGGVNDPGIGGVNDPGIGGVNDPGIGGVNDPGIGGVNDPGVGGGGAAGALNAEDCIGTAGESACEARGCNPLTGQILHLSGEAGGAGGAGGALSCGGVGATEFLGCVLGSGGATQRCYCQPGTDRCVEAGPELGWWDNGWEESGKCLDCGFD